MKLLDDHAVLLLVAFVLTLIVYMVLSLTGKPVDERIIGTIAVGALGGLLARTHD